MNIAIVETNRSQGEILRALLKSEGHELALFATVESCMGAAPAGNYQCFIVDCALPDSECVALIQALRTCVGAEPAIIALAETHDEEFVADVLRQGADDCIAKPVRYMEFMARVSAVLRRCVKEKPRALRIGHLELDQDGRQVRVAGRLVTLTLREYELASVLLLNAGRVLPREELLAAVWDKECDVDTRTVDTHASRLRKKLGLAGEHGLMLSSIYGQGYRLDTVQGG